MKKRVLLCIALTCAMLGAMAQASYTFNATALNVDGLPETISSITVNEGAPGEEGATKLCGILANSGWGIVGFSEDFNFHDYLTTTPASTYYNFGTHGGSVSGLSNSTDGLGFACLKSYTMEGETTVTWEEEYGTTSDGADGLIEKGFRMYTVTLADGVAVDVYVLHMDAGTADDDSDYDDNGKDKNVVAREAQLTQLATYIKNNHNNRPVIILGDTNCRYTREALKTGFIDVINADSRFTIKDAWVDLMWGGTYPTYGGESMMTSTYGAQKGEVVDKVFYINTTESDLTLKANSYLNDASISVSDHTPIVVNFTITDPAGVALTDAEKEASWTLEESVAGNKKPTWEGEQVVSGTTYYMMNVGTGEYIKWGGAYYTEAVGGNAGAPITPTTSDGGNTWVLKTSRNQVGVGDYTYLDQTGTWYLEPVSGTSYQYRIKSTSNLYLTANTSEAHKPIKSEAYSDATDNQKWIFLTDDRIRTEMEKANADYPFNFTALLKSADFDVIEYEDGWTANWSNFDQSDGPFMGVGAGWGGDASLYVSYAYANNTSATTMSQNLGTLPNGTYNISFEGFYRSRYSYKGGFLNLTTYTADEELDAVVSFGSTDIAIPQNTSTDIGAAVDVVGPLFRDGDSYLTSGQATLSSSTDDVTLSVTKPATSSTAVGGWICIDNFKLIYYGTGEVAVDPYKDYKDMVLTKVNETYEKVIQLNDAGQAAYDITVVIDRYNNDQITSGEIAQAMCDIVDAAYANALATHKAYYVEVALENMEANGGDVTGAIINPSFETGDLTGWTVGSGWDVGVYLNSNATYTASGCDGDYLFNAYSGDEGHTTNIQQTITGLTNGLYELKASLTSFSTTDMTAHTEHYRIYLTGNGYHTSVAADEGKGVFKEATLYFLVEDGTATIGAVGGNKGGGTEFIHYWPWEGCFFKADNFRLKYICDVPHGRLKLALDEANAATLDAYGQTALDLSSYETTYADKSLSGDGTTEVTAIYTALQTAAKAQRTAGADMTWTIENPSFETGDYTGWSTTAKWDTGAREQEDDTYSIAGTNGRYLFNTWNNADGTNNTNETITQTVTGIPNGSYILTAMLATNSGSSLQLIGNGTAATIAASTNGNSSGVFPSVTCEVTDNTLTIEAGGVDGAWYKADDFHLTYLGHEITLSEEGSYSDINDWYTSATVNRTIKAGKWATFVCPFDIPASALTEWEVMALDPTESTLSGDKITITFDRVYDGIKAGVPYMVRNTTMTENLTSITMENVVVNTTANNAENTHVEFVGTYKSMNIPQGAYFISDNVFYQAEDESNTIKAFRAYFTAKLVATNARSLGYRFVGDDDEGEGGTTAIDTPHENATVVGIYTTAGVRTDELHEGVNIVQMSDGTVVKVVIE